MNQTAQPTPVCTSSTDALTALIGRCDICGTVNAVDLAWSPQNEKEMQDKDRTVTRHTRAEAIALWNNAKRCDHKATIAALSSHCAELEAKVARVEELRDHLLKLPDGHEDFCNNIGESVAAALSGPAMVEKKG